MKRKFKKEHRPETHKSPDPFKVKHPAKPISREEAAATIRETRLKYSAK